MSEGFCLATTRCDNIFDNINEDVISARILTVFIGANVIMVDVLEKAPTPTPFHSMVKFIIYHLTQYQYLHVWASSGTFWKSFNVFLEIPVKTWQRFFLK